MACTYQLTRTQQLPLGRDELFPFFADAANLEAITPDFLHFRITSPQPVEIAAGTIIEYRLQLFGIPFHWQTLIEAFEPPGRFVDCQLRGPYKLWRHTHEFVENDEGTLMIDRVDYQLPWGPLGWLVHRLFVRSTLEQIFDYRRQRIEVLLVHRMAGAGA